MSSSPDALKQAQSFEQSGNFPDAERMYRSIASRDPKNTSAYRGLGVCLRRLGRIDEAVQALLRALELNPDFPEALNSLGNCLQDQGKIPLAIKSWEKSARLRPTYPEPYFNMGAALRRLGNLPAAEALLRKAIELRPNYVDALNTLGNVLRDAGQHEQALTAYEQAIKCMPTYAIAHNNLANALKDIGQLSRAEEYLRRAIELEPGTADFHSNLGGVLQDMGRIDDAQAAWKQALQLRLDFASAGSNLLLSLHYHDGDDAEFVFREHVGWARRFALPLATEHRPFDLDRTPGRTLRVGYVSPDLRRHSVAYFIESVLRSYDPSRFEIVCYSDAVRPDDVTTRLKSYVKLWRNIVGVDDAMVADAIRQDRIDILVDLAGHTACNRQLVFARRPAPVQVTYLGYCNTTGQDAIDHALTDAHLDPPATDDSPDGQQWHSEHLVRLPGCFVCYHPPQDAPDVVVPPCVANGFVTFGSFNNFTKITPAMLHVWAQVLHATPVARLLIKAPGLGDPVLRHTTTRALQELGISTDRVELLDREPSYAKHMATYGRVDIALDTYPYHGTTTTCEAMWMGVPTITLAGPTRVSRVGVSLLSNAGLSDLIASTPEAYVEIARALASDIERLTSLRTSMRERLRTTGLIDAPRFTRELEKAYQAMWDQLLNKPTA